MSDDALLDFLHMELVNIANSTEDSDGGDKV